MAEGIKISEFPEIDELQAESSFPTISEGENKKITFEKLTKLLFGQSFFDNDNCYKNLTLTWKTNVARGGSAKFMRKGDIVMFTIDFIYLNNTSVVEQEVFRGLPEKYIPNENVYFSAVSDITYEDYESTIIKVEASRLQLKTNGIMYLDVSGCSTSGSNIKLSGIYTV